MEYENKLVLIEKYANNVAKLTLNNPPLNLVTLDLSHELYETLCKIDNDDEVRAVVLTGSGSRAFSVGSDIKEFPNVWDDVIEKKLKKENEAFNQIEFLSKPVIAAMEGTTCGGGCEISLACDIRIMAEDATIALPEVNLGVFPASGGIFRLSKLIGPGRALEMMYLGEFISAQEAESIGLVNHVVPAGETIKFAMEMAAKIAKKPVESIRTIKKGTREMWLKTTEECFHENLRASAYIFKTPDCAEGVNAFLKKRAPQFN